MKFAMFVLSSLLCFVVAHYLLEDAAAAYGSVLISYHFFLVFLVVEAQHEKALSMPIGSMILTHSAFLAFLIGFCYLRGYVPYFGLISLLVPALAPLETMWLFSRGRRRRTHAAAGRVDIPAATLEDSEAFREYMEQQDRPFRKAGRPISEEFDLWLADRAKKKAEAEASADASPAVSGDPADSGAAPPE